MVSTRGSKRKANSNSNNNSNQSVRTAIRSRRRRPPVDYKGEKIISESWGSTSSPVATVRSAPKRRAPPKKVDAPPKSDAPAQLTYEFGEDGTIAGPVQFKDGKLYFGGLDHLPEKYQKMIHTRLRTNMEPAYEVYPNRWREDRVERPADKKLSIKGRVGGPSISSLQFANAVEKREREQRLMEHRLRNPSKRSSKVMQRPTEMSSLGRVEDEIVGALGGLGHHTGVSSIRHPQNKRFFETHFKSQADDRYHAMLSEASDLATTVPLHELDVMLLAAREIVKRHNIPDARLRVRTIREAIHMKTDMGLK